MSDAKVILDEENQRGFRFSLRSLFWLTVVVAFLLWGIVWFTRQIEQAMEAFMVGNPGPVVDEQEWPEPLREVAVIANKKSIPLKNLKVFCFESGWVGDSYAWRMEATPGLFEVVFDKYQLQKQTEVERSIFLASNPRNSPEEAAWWIVPEPEACTFYANSGFLNQDQEDSFQVAVDENYGLIYVYYYWDF